MLTADTLTSLDHKLVESSRSGAVERARDRVSAALTAYVTEQETVATTSKVATPAAAGVPSGDLDRDDHDDWTAAGEVGDQRKFPVTRTSDAPSKAPAPKSGGSRKQSVGKRTPNDNGVGKRRSHEVGLDRTKASASKPAAGRSGVSDKKELPGTKGRVSEGGVSEVVRGSTVQMGAIKATRALGEAYNAVLSFKGMLDTMEEIPSYLMPQYRRTGAILDLIAKAKGLAYQSEMELKRMVPMARL